MLLDEIDTELVPVLLNKRHLPNQFRDDFFLNYFIKLHMQNIQ